MDGNNPVDDETEPPDVVDEVECKRLRSRSRHGCSRRSEQICFDEQSFSGQIHDEHRCRMKAAADRKHFHSSRFIGECAAIRNCFNQWKLRRFCERIGKDRKPPPREILEDLELTSEQVRGKRFYRGAGCEVCNNTGYKGRLGLFELMIMNNDLRDKIMANAQTDELRTLAIKHGMVSLRHAGIQSCFDGITTPDEVVRETILEA